MPNGMYGGVRGKIESPLLDQYAWKVTAMLTRTGDFQYVNYCNYVEAIMEKSYNKVEPSP